MKRRVQRLWIFSQRREASPPRAARWRHVADLRHDGRCRRAQARADHRTDGRVGLSGEKENVGRRGAKLAHDLARKGQRPRARVSAAEQVNVMAGLPPGCDQAQRGAFRTAARGVVDARDDREARG